MLQTHVCGERHLPNKQLETLPSDSVHGVHCFCACSSFAPSWRGKKQRHSLPPCVRQRKQTAPGWSTPHNRSCCWGAAVKAAGQLARLCSQLQQCRQQHWARPAAAAAAVTYGSSKTSRRWISCSGRQSCCCSCRSSSSGSSGGVGCCSRAAAVEGGGIQREQQQQQQHRRGGHLRGRHQRP